MGKEKEQERICECDTKKTRGYALYYDSPDGCNIPEKVMVTTRYGILTGLIFGTYDCLMYSHAVGLSHMIQRYMVHTVPLATMAITFTVVANGALHLREKDDPWNYFLGGLACGPILGKYLGSKHGILLGGLALGVVGFIKKTGVDDDWEFFPQFHSHKGQINSWRDDFTIARDPKLDEVNKCG